MDLSFLKWPIIILVVGGIAFGLSTPGVNYVYEKTMDKPVGQNDNDDTYNEMVLSKIGGYLLSTFRYEFANKAYNSAINRYPDGVNAWWNYYQMARTLEKMEKWEQAVDILAMLRDEDAEQYDGRVPNTDILNLRMMKLIEVHELDDRKWNE